MTTRKDGTAGGESATARTVSVDVVVVGAGTSGCYAAATIADAGYDVVVVERKDETEAGHIACGDALKGKSPLPNVIDRDHLDEESFANTNIQHFRVV
jgi:flavin-dependent dehydrogenase